MVRLAQTLGVFFSRVIASESTVETFLPKFPLPACNIASRSSSVFMFAGTQRTSSPVCGLSVLRRPARLGSVEPASSRHRENPFHVRCTACCPQTAIGSRGGGALAAVASSQAKSSSTPARFSLQVLHRCLCASQHRCMAPKSGPGHHRCAPRPSQQMALAAIHRQCTPNRSLNRTHCGARPKARHFILGL